MKKGTHKKPLKRAKSITQKPFRPKTLKPQHTRKLIRRFHVLLKAKSAILAKLQWPEQYEDIVRQNHHEVYDAGRKKDPETVYKLEGLGERDLVAVLGQIDSEIDRNGGLEVYQIASQQGQSTKRGSDSSKKLVEWLKQGYQLDQDLTAFEIGCLSPNNCISTSKIFKSIKRIDLNSQHHLIEQQDFMKMPLPGPEKYNVVSCSLVLNFVTTPEQRGEMLRKITKFLTRTPTADANNPASTAKSGSVSALFLVLPLPCVSNSRYLDEEKLRSIMSVLGFSQRFSHKSSKLAYWLFDWNGNVQNKPVKKTEIHKGANRNNFAITLS